VSRQFQQTVKQTCLFDCKAHERPSPKRSAVYLVSKSKSMSILMNSTPPPTDRLTVVGMGVGTKFLSELSCGA
jgi:hypothetical protein